MFGCVPTRKQEENEIAKALPDTVRFPTGIL